MPTATTEQIGALFPLAASASVSETPHRGFAHPSTTLHQAIAYSKPLQPPGLRECLYDFRRRSRCTGKERDSETGLDYFGARYFSAAQGRWTSADEPLADQHPGDPQSWNMYVYGRDNPLRNVDPDGAAVIDAGVVLLGTASFRVYHQESNLDAAAILPGVEPGEIGAGQKKINRNLEEMKQNQSSFRWMPQEHWDEAEGVGGCVMGCLSSFSEQAIGVTLNLSFSYDQNDKLTGANITMAADPAAHFIGPNPPPMVGNASMMPGGQAPAPQLMAVSINPSALKGLSPQQLQAVAKAVGGVQNPAVRQALATAVGNEQKRRTNEAQKACGTQGGQCSSH